MCPETLKRILVLLLMSFGSLAAASQDDRLNQLLQEYSDSKANAADHLYCLNEITAYYMDHDKSEQANIYIRESWDLIKKKPHLNDCNRTYQMQGLLLLYAGQLNEAIPFFEKGISFSKEFSDKKTQVKGYSSLSEIHARFLSHDLANKYIDSTLTLAKEINYQNAIASALNCRAYLEDNLGNKTEAIEIFNQLIQFYHDTVSEEVAVIYNNIGELHRKLGNYELAKESYKKAMEINQQVSSMDNLIMNYSNMGAALMDQDSAAAGKRYYALAIDLCKQYDNLYFKAMAYHNMALVYESEEELELAVRYVDSSFALCVEQNYGYGIVMNQMKYGDFNFALKKYAAAVSIFFQALDGADSLQMVQEKISIYNSIHLCYKQLDDAKLAIKYLTLTYQLQDSLLLDEKNRTILDLQSKYDKEKTEQQISKLEQTVLEKESRTRVFIITFLSIIILFTFVIFFLLIIKRNREIEIEKNLAENELLKRDITYKNKELGDYAHYLSEQYQITIDFARKSNDLFEHADLDFKKRLHSIHRDLLTNSQMNNWKEFEARFERVNNGFYDSLLALYPDLTPTELRLCSFLRLNLCTREIAGLLNRTTGTVDNARSNLRKKMRIESDESLSDMLLSI